MTTCHEFIQPGATKYWAEHQLKIKPGKTFIFRATHFLQEIPSAQEDAINPIHCKPIQVRNDSPDHGAGHEPPHLVN